MKRDGLSLANSQLQYARALQTWADVTPLNFHFVSDDGLPANTLRTPTQGDPDFGDIRFGGEPTPGGISYTFPPYGGPLAGCSFLATDVTWGTSGSPGTYNDLYSIILHETGHALGLYGSTDPNAVMFQYVGTSTGLAPDDIAGIQAIYGESPPDPMGHSFATATPLILDSTRAAGVSARLSSVSDEDYYQVTTPASFDGTMSVSVDARNLSLLDPKVAVFDAAGNLLAAVSAATYGSVATVQLAGLSPGQTYYLVASGARPALLSSNDANVFGMGAYTLDAQFGGVTIPSLAIDNVALTSPNRGTKQVLFTATLSAPTSIPVTVKYATADGTAVAGRAYLPTSGTLTFAPGQTQQTIAVTVKGAATYEPTETFDVVLSNSTNATLDVTQGTGTIENDHPAPDRFEPNNTPATAAHLGALTSLNLTGLTISTATDVQWFQFVAGSSGTYRVSAMFAQVGGTGGYLGMALFNTRLTLLTSGQSDTGKETLTVKLVAGRTYYLRLRSPSHSMFTFDLAIAS